MNRIGLIVLLFSFYGVSFCEAQNDLRFEHLTTREGLSQSVVRSICQDREGFMWFGTYDGLNKYDGYSFTVFKSDPNNPRHTFHHNSITDIHEDRKGRLWVATLGGGLHLVDKRTGNVTAYEIHPNESKGWDSSTRRWNTLYTIFEDSKGILWTASKGLARFDPDTKRHTLYEAPRFIDAVVEDSLGRFWVSGIEGVNLFDQKKGTFTPVLIDPSLAKQPLITSLILDANGLLWAGGLEGGLWRLDTRRSPLTFTRYNPGGVVNKGIRFNGILADKTGQLWLATVTGLQRIDTKSNQVTTHRADASQSGSIGSDLINSTYQDRSGVLWVGTNNGINRAITQAKPFRSYQISPSLPSVRLNTNYINALWEDHTGGIWLASNADMFDGGFKNGLFRFEPKLRQIKSVVVDIADPSSNDVSTIYEDRQHRLWVGTANSLYQLNRTTGKFSHVPYPYSVRRIVEDHSGKLWLPSSPNRGESAVLTAFDPDLGTSTEYHYNEKDTSGLNNTFFYDILVSRNGDIYLATGGGGINRLNPKTGKFSHYMPDSQHPAGRISDKDVRCLYEDSQGIIWAGTGLGGLNRFDPHTGTFMHYTTREGLPSNNILSVIGDAGGNLWIGTNRGLSRFNPATTKFRNYSMEDGLPDNEFNGSVVQSHEGKLLFGTRNGFFSFDPDSIKDNTTPPPVYITGLTVLERQRPVPEKQLELSYQENFLTFEFVTLNYNSPEKNQYAFQLVGLDPNWVYSGSRRSARYTDLTPGTYTFRVKAANNDGVWNEKGATLAVIIIHPPWWQTWWAYTLYALLTISAIWAIIHYRSLALRRKNRELEEQVSLRTAELRQSLANLKTTQNQLIQKEKLASLGELTAGIAHEIQNPLNFVNNFAEVSVELADELHQSVEEDDKPLSQELANDLRQNMTQIELNGKRASNIVRAMLEHSSASSGERQPTDLNALAEEYLKLAYHGFRRSGDPGKHSDFTATLKTDFAGDLPHLEMVAGDVGRVLLNLYNNAFYAIQQRQLQETEDYEPSIWVSTRLVEDSVELRVKDNGLGIPAPIQAKVFQPFFTTKPTGQGTGLGLSLSYDIITKGHGGEMYLESQEGQGTEFIIRLPIQ